MLMVYVVIAFAAGLAELFTGTFYLAAVALAALFTATIAILDAAKAPPQRVSLSGWRLRYTRDMFFLAAGSGKRPALAAWLRGEALPAATVGTTADIWLDAAAWPGTTPAPV